MIARESSASVQQPANDPIDIVEPLSLKRIVAVLQVVLAIRRAAFSDEHRYWYTLARGM